MNARIFLIALVSASVVVAASASAAPAKKRKAPNHWHAGFGYLPGFSKKEIRTRARDRWVEENRGPHYLYGGPGYWSSFSRPGFYRSRWNGGGFGPCWTRTPIGMIWNCG